MLSLAWTACSPAPSAAPKPTASLAKPLPEPKVHAQATAIATDGYRTCVIRARGLWCWGEGFDELYREPPSDLRPWRDYVIGVGDLGDATSQDPLLPFRVPGVETDGPLWGTTCYGGAGSTIVCMECNWEDSKTCRWAQKEAGAAEIEGGFRFNCLRMADKTVRCRGHNQHGELGPLVPRTREMLPARTLGGLPPIVQLSAGWDSACGVADDASVWCWGSHLAGFGVQAEERCEDEGCNPTPVRLQGLPPVAAVVIEHYHLCVRLADGGVACWSKWPPTVVPDLEGVVELKATNGRNCARLSNGTVKCWNQSHGEFGEGPNPKGKASPGRAPLREGSERPELVPGLTEVAELALGLSHLCFRRRNGDVFCMGSNESGELGAPTEQPRSEQPVVVAFPQ